MPAAIRESHFSELPQQKHRVKACFGSRVSQPIKCAQNVTLPIKLCAR
jgi:hypothetical protein